MRERNYRVVILFLIFGLISLWTSCTKEDELTPVISNFLYNESPAQQSQEFEVLDELEIGVQVDDDGGLQEVRIAFSTDYSVADTLEDPTWAHQNEWDVVRILAASGSSAEPSFTVQFPDTIAGDWMITAQALDQSGNVSEEEWIHLVINNPFIPKLNDLTSTPAADSTSTITLATGQSLALLGSVTDDMAIDSLYFALYNTGIDTTYWSQSQANWSAASFDLASLTIGSISEVSSNLAFRIYAQDYDGRHAEWELSLKTE